MQSQDLVVVKYSSTLYVVADVLPTHRRQLFLYHTLNYGNISVNCIKISDASFVALDAL